VSGIALLHRMRFLVLTLGAVAGWAAIVKASLRGRTPG